MNEPGYEQLAEVLEAAFHQAANGKGKERHANDLPFHEQRMLGISRLLDGDGGMAYQACKKIAEARGLAHDARERELLGTIVYIAGMVIFHRERMPVKYADGEITFTEIHRERQPVLKGKLGVLGGDWPNESRRVEQEEMARKERNVPSILEPVDLSELLDEAHSAKTAAALDQAREIREEWDERRMDIIGQNGNDGLHYDALPYGLTWLEAPGWATHLGSIGISKRLVWYSEDQYRYLESGCGYEFRKDGEISCRRSRGEVEHIASRPSKAPEQRDDGWTEWAGGKCPAPCEFVDVILRNGKQHNRVHASAMRWEHIKDAGDVVLYRVHKDDSHE